MLLPSNHRFNFADAAWDALCDRHPNWILFLSGGSNEQGMQERYHDFMDTTPERLAAFFNFAEALGAVQLPNGVAFDYLVKPLTAQLADSCFADRCFAFAKIGLVEQLEAAVIQGAFEHANSTLHPGATRSFKEKRFGEANLQITLHEKDRKTIEEDICLKVEIDMDYYRDNLAHVLLEVLPNQFGGTTDPRQIYVLRWIAGRRAGVREFNPPYKIV